MRPGARPTADGTVRFALWAPRVSAVELHLVDEKRALPMATAGHGYHLVETDLARPGSRYSYRVDGIDHPDPASFSQPDGVHGPSQVIDFRGIEWTDAGFVPAPLASLVIYEMHIGTFTPAGTFAAARERLADLASLGVTALEIMPIAEFPGTRNWGYDGVSWYAAQSSYGGPIEFARFVDAAHAVGLTVLLDVVFNHFGPEGNYSGRFGDYMTDRYRTPWGEALNVDGPGSDQVREFVYGCVEHWIDDCHVDGFRLDAVHEIHDESASPFLAEIGAVARAAGRRHAKETIVIAESDLNDRRLTVPASLGGYGLDAVWADDFHHSVHALLTGERQGYYADYDTAAHLVRAIERGWSYAGDYSPARGRRHGNDPVGLPARSFVFCTQNHDQVGNRMLGERLRSIAGPDAERVSRALLLLTPCVPLLFMGQEYGEDRPFLYFVDHTDAGLLEATRVGRAREFAAFHAHGQAPDPGASQTRERSVPAWRTDGPDLEMTRELLGLRARYDCFRPAAEATPEVARRARAYGSVVVVELDAVESNGLVIANLGSVDAVVPPQPDAAADRDASRPRRVFATPNVDRSVDAREMRLPAFSLVAHAAARGGHPSHR